MPQLSSIKKTFITLCLPTFFLMTACQQPENYAPVKVVNQSIPTSPAHARHSPQKTHPTQKHSPSEAERVLDGSDNGNSQYKTAPFAPEITKMNQRQLKSPGHTAKPKSNRAVNEEISIKKQSVTSIARNKKQSTEIEGEKTKTATKAPHLDKDKITPVAIAKNPLIVSNHKKKSTEKTSTISINNKKVLKLNFRWPIRGKVIKNFIQSDRKGIDIAGKAGQSVYAAETGKAVYCGQGLAGYGKLIILKHNSAYLSAYAHNSQLNVSEGQLVEKGERIGTIGSKGRDKAVLHFEIRKDGLSINPLALLPKN